VGAHQTFVDELKITNMDTSTVITCIKDAAAAIVSLFAVWKIIAKMFKPKRPVIDSAAPAEITTRHTPKPAGVRVMDSIIPLGLILLTVLPFLAGGDIFRVVMVCLAFVISGFYIFVISTSKS
jgi:hypothetical protein